MFCAFLSRGFDFSVVVLKEDYDWFSIFLLGGDFYLFLREGDFFPISSRCFDFSGVNV